MDREEGMVPVRHARDHGQYPVVQEQERRFEYQVDGVEFSKKIIGMFNQMLDTRKNDLLNIAIAKAKTTKERRDIEAHLLQYNQEIQHLVDSTNVDSDRERHEAQRKRHNRDYVYENSMEQLKEEVSMYKKRIRHHRWWIDRLYHRRSNLESAVWPQFRHGRTIADLTNRISKHRELINKQKARLKADQAQLNGIASKALGEFNTMDYNRDKKLAEINQKFDRSVFESKSKLFEVVDSYKLKNEKNGIQQKGYTMTIDFESWALADLGDEYKVTTEEYLKEIRDFSKKVLSTLSGRENK